MANTLQGVVSFVLRVGRNVVPSVLIGAGPVWGIGRVGSCSLAFDASRHIPAALQDATGF